MLNHAPHDNMNKRTLRFSAGVRKCVSVLSSRPFFVETWLLDLTRVYPPGETILVCSSREWARVFGSIHVEMWLHQGLTRVYPPGESILVCSAGEWARVSGVLRGGVRAARSGLAGGAGALLLSAAALGLARSRRALRALLACTLLARSPEVDLKALCDESIRALMQSGALEVDAPRDRQEPGDEGNCYVHDDDVLSVSRLGRAAIKGCIDLQTTKQLLSDLQTASRGLVLMGSLHLIYLVTPHDAAGVKPDYRHYYSLYGNLDEEGLQTAKILGITEMNAIRMMTGKPITNVPEIVLCRFYLALMLHDLWKQVPFADVAEKYCLSRGTVQGVMASAAAFASSAHKVCEVLGAAGGTAPGGTAAGGTAPGGPAADGAAPGGRGSVGWFTPLLLELGSRLQHCAAPELQQLMELPGVKKARALQLSRGGFKRVEDVARAAPDQLAAAVDHLSRSAAAHLISAARMMLIEKVENLRAEAEDVMEELQL